MKKIFLVFAIGLFLISCKKEIPIKVETHDLKYVMHAIVQNDSSVKVVVSRSLRLNEDLDSNVFVRNAIVSLYENGSFVENLNYVKLGIYQGNYLLKVNSTYKVVTKIPDVDVELFGEIKFPEVILPDSVYIEPKFFNDTIKKYDQFGNVVGDTIVRTLFSFIVNIAIEDKPNLRSFYLFNFITIPQDSLYLRTIPYNIIAPDINNENSIVGTPYQLEYFYFTAELSGPILVDNFFDGHKYTIKLEIPAAYLTGLAQNYDEIKLRLLYNIFSPELYLFVSSYNKYLGTSIFSEPVNVYSNVQNGIGIVAGVFTKKFDLDITEYIPYLRQQHYYKNLSSHKFLR